LDVFSERMKPTFATLGLLFALSLVPVTAREHLVYFGTYTGAKSKGIYVSRFDDKTGTLSTAELAAETKSPSFLALHPNRRVLYAVGEAASVGETRQGAVTAFTIEPRTGRLTVLTSQPSGGGGPCHLTLDAKRGLLFTANYGSGSVGALPLRADGTLDAPVSVAQHTGSSVNPRRQEGPHAHCANLDPTKKFLLVCDLGLDKVMVYRLGDGAAALTPNDPPFASVAPGAGPRHLAFQLGGKFVHVLNELNSTITTFAFNPQRGTLEEGQTVSTLPAGFSGSTTCAEIEVHPSGKFVYASNRGHDSIAVFAADKQTGLLSPVEHEPTQGKTPRHFALDPSGRWLLAANQGSDSVVVFAVNPQTGVLETTGQLVEVPSPVCAVFLPIR
jgi:6-phosphogluconolactonase